MDNLSSETTWVAPSAALTDCWMPGARRLLQLFQRLSVFLDQYLELGRALAHSFHNVGGSLADESLVRELLFFSCLLGFHLAQLFLQTLALSRHIDLAFVDHSDFELCGG